MNIREFHIRSGVVIALLGAWLTGCTSANTDLSPVTAVFTPAPAYTPNPGAKKSGDYPDLRKPVAGATQHLSEAEKVQTAEELNRISQEGERLSSQPNEAIYRRGIREIQ